MTTQDISYGRMMQLALAEVHPLRERHTRLAVGVDPSADSPAPVELRRGIGELFWIFALQRWAGASDHALAWGYLLIEAKIQPMAAHLTLIRAVIEGATMVRWLIDPNATAAVRCLRGVAVQLEDHRERERFERLGVAEQRPAMGRARTGARRIAILER